MMVDSFAIARYELTVLYQRRYIIILINILFCCVVIKIRFQLHLITVNENCSDISFTHYQLII